MSKSQGKPDSQKTAPLSGDPPPESGYDAWARAKIEAALRDAVEHPAGRIPIEQVWKKFDLEH